MTAKFCTKYPTLSRSTSRDCEKMYTLSEIHEEVDDDTMEAGMLSVPHQSFDRRQRSVLNRSVSTPVFVFPPEMSSFSSLSLDSGLKSPRSLLKVRSENSLDMIAEDPQ
ncbi:hypothetical protein SARC_00673 [Sphaeroforma arctica JP610]|uniref:Uncharacterized protein n=1 Tax=Sphaeroforma arctica JP610 TaxID=667725 RepID=A0A0L0GE91_9EUKA|nr:hypothetical protein SARC_00673 [Sphaeroforma arctica JP610]KNC87196.1 hypothetical protein SARC_00673 [Sphaeroforma arctica JP610]|eukprot:XP_014161098.1 hypothetical protein SARC_00673 [Sphaeroforma arctica JP610]